MISIMSAPSVNKDCEILQYYLERLNEAQKSALLSVARAFVNEPEEQPEDGYSDAFVAELDRRTAAYKSGAVKAVSWEDAKARILSDSQS